jgi:hypothetical protein
MLGPDYLPSDGSVDALLHSYQPLSWPAIANRPKNILRFLPRRLFHPDRTVGAVARYDTRTSPTLPIRRLPPCDLGGHAPVNHHPTAHNSGSSRRSLLLTHPGPKERNPDVLLDKSCRPHTHSVRVLVLSPHPPHAPLPPADWPLPKPTATYISSPSSASYPHRKQYHTQSGHHDFNVTGKYACRCGRFSSGR